MKIKSEPETDFVFSRFMILFLALFNKRTNEASCMIFIYIPQYSDGSLLYRNFGKNSR